MRTILIANRGEVAVRVLRTCADLGLRACAVFAEEEADAAHVALAPEAVRLPGRGPAAYLDPEALVAAALAAGCDALHPGWGFLSESAALARACAAAGVLFIGPAPEVLELFGDKLRTRAFAAEAGVRVPRGAAVSSAADVEALRAELPAGAPLMIKAVSGGGGRGMRRLEAGAEAAALLAEAAREARAAFGDGALYAEEVVGPARHIEVQVAGDGARAGAFGDRDCSLQRRRQKVVEIAPAPGLPDAVRDGLAAAALRLAETAGLRGLATFEFLVPFDGPQDFSFIECNPRLQVEHTVTEEIFDVDLVALQLRLAAGADLEALGLLRPRPRPGARAVQLRVTLERILADGSARPGAGPVLERFDLPSGPGVRVDACGRVGSRTRPEYDPLIAKLIVRGDPPGAGLAGRAQRALKEFRIEGPSTNLPFLEALLNEPGLLEGSVDTLYLDREGGRIAACAAEAEVARSAPPITPEAAEGGLLVRAPISGTLIAFEAEEGDLLAEGATLALIEAMKMHHVVAAPAAGRVRARLSEIGSVLEEGAPLARLDPEDGPKAAADGVLEDFDAVREDLQALRARLALTTDAARPEAVARRRQQGRRTARENLAAVFDGGVYQEFGALAVAAQQRRRSLEDLQRETPADGLLTAVGSVNADVFGPERARCVGLAYDYTVLAGTQGYFGHKKTDRILEFAETWRAPVVWFVEGGGGRPGDVDLASLKASALDTTSFTTFARLSGVAPRIAIASGRCFAGNAVFFGCADVTIATRDANIGLGGPAMIEGGGLGRFRPEEIGPAETLWRNGVVDLLATDDAAAALAARRLLGVFQGAAPPGPFADQRRLRRAVPENRLRVYEIREVIETLADTGSFLELRGGYGRGMITGVLRLQGRPLGLIANDPKRLGGAIDAEGAEKAARFLQLCDAFDLPVLSLCDTPGFMVGPKSEETAAVRRGSRLFVAAAALSVPLFAVVLRKGYGLGAQAMTGGDFSAAAMTLAWPTAEFGPMGIEGAVRLGYRKELEAEKDPTLRAALFEKLTKRMYAVGKATSVAQALEIDAVIDPADTREWILRGLDACPVRVKERRRFVDVW